MLVTPGPGMSPMAAEATAKANQVLSDIAPI
jgi:hypothetical protein